jgi:hypothetical protein
VARAVGELVGRTGPGANLGPVHAVNPNISKRLIKNVSERGIEDFLFNWQSEVEISNSKCKENICENVFSQIFIRTTVLIVMYTAAMGQRFPAADGLPNPLNDRASTEYPLLHI